MRLKSWALDSGKEICLKKMCKSLLSELEKDLTTYFCSQDTLIHCNDVDGVMRVIDNELKPENWRLFIDSNKLSSKAVL